MKTVRRSLALLLGLLLILCCAACGAQEPPAATETPEPLPALSYPLEENTGSDAASYPYIVRTANAIWYLSAADMERVGRDAYFEWLDLVLKDQEADFDDARAVLAPWLMEEIPPVAIVTDFCAHAGEDTPFCDSAQYSKAQREIRLYHGTGRALLYEYVRYLTFSCAKREISPGFYSEGVSEYVSHFACENRMLRMPSREFWREANRNGHTIGDVPYGLQDYLRRRSAGWSDPLGNLLIYCLWMGGSFAIWFMRRQIDRHLGRLRRPAYYEAERRRLSGRLIAPGTMPLLHSSGLRTSIRTAPLV